MTNSIENIATPEKLGVGVSRQLDMKNNKDVDQRDIRLKGTARDFEKIFLTYMIRDMWKAIPTDEDSEMPGANIYLEMIQSALATEMAKGKGLGIAGMIYQQLKNKMDKDDNIVKPIKNEKLK